MNVATRDLQLCPASRLFEGVTRSSAQRLEGWTQQEPALLNLGQPCLFPPPTSVALLLGCGSLADRYPTAFTRRRTDLGRLERSRLPLSSFNPVEDHSRCLKVSSTLERPRRHLQSGLSLFSTHHTRCPYEGYGFDALSLSLFRITTWCGCLHYDTLLLTSIFVCCYLLPH